MLWLEFRDYLKEKKERSCSAARAFCPEIYTRPVRLPCGAAARDSLPPQKHNGVRVTTIRIIDAPIGRTGPRCRNRSCARRFPNPQPGQCATRCCCWSERERESLSSLTFTPAYSSPDKSTTTTHHPPRDDDVEVGADHHTHKIITSANYQNDCPARRNDGAPPWYVCMQLQLPSNSEPTPPVLRQNAHGGTEFLSFGIEFD